MNMIRKIAFVFGTGVLFATYFDMFIEHIFSGFHNYKIQIWTNHYGEYWIELVIFIVAGICIAYSVIPVFMDYFKKRDTI